MTLWQNPDDPDMFILRINQKMVELMQIGLDKNHTRFSFRPKHEPDLIAYWKRVMPPEVFAEFYPEVEVKEIKN